MLLVVVPLLAGAGAAVLTIQRSDPSYDASGKVPVAQSLSTNPTAFNVQPIIADFKDALFIEMGPGNVLTGLLTRIVPGARGIAVGTPADVEKLATQVAA